MLATLQGHIEGNNVIVREPDIRRYDGLRVLVVVQDNNDSANNKNSKRKEYLSRMRTKPSADSNKTLEIDQYLMEMRNDRD